jgi:hypothetical protein
MRRLFRIAIPFSLVTLSLAVALHYAVFAHRPARDLASSERGGSDNTPATNCSDNFPTPFAAVLNGQVTPTNADGSSCSNFNGAYPNYSFTLTPSDKSFTLTVTPVLWGGGNAQSTILHLEFASTSPTLSLQSFVIGGLTMSGQAATDGPSYVACDFGQAVSTLYLLPVDDGSGGIFDACDQPTMEDPTAPAGTLGFASAIQPTAIQFADTNTTRWDIEGIAGSAALPNPLPSVDLYVPGVPSDLISALGISLPAASNNLTSSFMGSQSHFLAVAFDSSKNQMVTAGGLSIPSVTATLTNDSVSTPTVVDAASALSANGFVDQVNAVTATPQENSDGTFLNPPTNPSDPILSGTTCFAGKSGDSAIFRTVWYSFTPTGDGKVTISTAKSRYDTVLAMYTGQPGALTLVGCDDDVVDSSGTTHVQAMLGSIPVTHGTPYLILVGESPAQTGVLNDIDGNPTSQTVAAPLSKDATLFFSLVETPTPAAVTLSPPSGTALSFGTQQVGVASQSQKVSVTSNGGTPLTVSNIAVPAGFAFTTTCNAPLPQGAQCEIDVTMNPTAAGSVSGNLTFSDNATVSSPSYSLTGTGVDFTFPAPAVTTGTLTSTTNATYNLSVSGSAAFANAVTFACSGLPANTQCGFQPDSATPGGGKSAPVVLTVSRISNTGAQSWPELFMRTSGVTVALLFFLFCGGKRRTIARLRLMALTLCFAWWIVSCGGGGSSSTTTTQKQVPPSPGSYPFSVTATSSGHSAPAINLSLTVQ